MSNRRRSSIGAHGSLTGHELAEQNKDAIRVICRFRPPNKLSGDAKKNLNDKSDVWRLNENTGECEYASDYGDNKIFKFDQVC